MTLYESIQSAADRLAVNPRTIRRLIESGQLVAYHVGNKAIRLKVDDVEAALRPVPPNEVTS